LTQWADELKRWYSYKDARFKEQLREWLEMEEIESTNEPGTGTVCA